MEDNPPHSRFKKTRPRRSSSPSSVNTSSSSSSSSSSLRTQGRFLEPAEVEDCSIECTGKSCRACSATMVADCVALCCCPLAVVSLLVLTFIKVPYVMGRKCLGRRKRRIKEKRKAKEEKDYFGAMERSRDIVFEFGEGELLEQRKSLCTGLIELDNVLLELYQVGHLGFGRVSFTGIQPI